MEIQSGEGKEKSPGRGAFGAAPFPLQPGLRAPPEPGRMEMGKAG